MNRIPLFLFLLLPIAACAAAESELLTKIREDLRSANESRSRHGSEVAAWRAESQRHDSGIESCGVNVGVRGRLDALPTGTVGGD